MQQKQRMITLLMLLSLTWLVACTGEGFTEPTPIPPPPTSGSEDENTAVTDPTPIPTEVPDETAIEPTPTLIPTMTPTATAAATAVTNPPVQVISSQPLPATSRDLLFLADGAFKQWNHTTGQIETIVPGPATSNPTPENPDIPEIGTITDYSMSADGKRAVVARVLSTATNPDLEYTQPEFTHELLFIDMISREVWTLVPQVDNLEAFQLSPDAQQLAFVGSGLDGIPDAIDSDPIANNLFVMATGGGNPGSVRQVYSCQSRCIHPEWHIESNLVAFGDSTALWLYNIAADEPELMLENQRYFPEMEDLGEISIYSPIEWANNGRYLLLWRGRWEGGSRAVLDVPTGSLVQVPDSFVYADLYPMELGWMSDDRLLVWRTENDETNTIPMVELWRFDLGAEELILEESARLSDQPLGVTGGANLEDGRFAFSLHSYGPESESALIREITGLYQLTSLAEIPERVNTLPPVYGIPRQANVFWSQDGSGALLSQRIGAPQLNIYYAPTNGEFLYDLTAVFGQNPHDFQWQPEIIVP